MFLKQQGNHKNGEALIAILEKWLSISFYLVFYIWKMGPIILSLYRLQSNAVRINEICVESCKLDELRDHHCYSIGFFK